ncbi:CLUMA_CG002905, isoform A [Clunio marinus]|uniref:CLUMA_CG002905, isoform A n=1 Tax=Clunio marinus TaxID=568069 RepID=A0A1J1HM41_9DIPT|nr:CLUMA_CG002905, isoform A [Clunio marinus]
MFTVQFMKCFLLVKHFQAEKSRHGNDKIKLRSEAKETLKASLQIHVQIFIVRYFENAGNSVVDIRFELKAFQCSIQLNLHLLSVLAFLAHEFNSERIAKRTMT